MPIHIQVKPRVKEKVVMPWSGKLKHCPDLQRGPTIKKHSVT